MPVTIDFFALQRGDVLPETSLRIEAGDVRAYREATGEAGAPSGDLWGAEGVPPLALAALVLATLTDQLPLPTGTVHVGQEFEFLRPATTGLEMMARATVSRRTQRRGTLVTMLSLELRAAGEIVLAGLTTLITPAAGGGS